MKIKTDTLITTYNSARYLEECLASVMETIPVNRLIAVDHYSEDGTVDILRKFGAEIYQEKIGLGYARQLAIDLAGTDVVTFVDSDIVFREKGWWEEAYNLLMSDEKIGAVVARVEVDMLHDRIGTPRMKYTYYWWGRVPKIKKIGLTAGSTLFRLEALRKFRIPSKLDAREDRFMEINLLKQNLTIRYTFPRGVHYFDHGEEKPYWLGAGTRIVASYIKDPDWKETSVFYLLFRRVLTAFFKGIPPALHYKDPNVVVWNTLHWWKFLMGWLNPDKYRKMKRIPSYCQFGGT